MTPHVRSAEKPDHLLWEQGGEFDEATYLEIFGQAIDAFRSAGRPFLLFGGLASSHFGRPRSTHDIDIFVKGADADEFLKELEAHAFRTQRTYPDWLYKALKEGVLVDVIFRSAGNIYMDEEMISRAVTGEIFGREVPLLPPEDMVVIKATAHKENSPRHLHDVVAILSKQALDWEYLVWRARLGVRRVLSFLLFARSEWVEVPREALVRLARGI
jgi:predicted nucleotidyltransferase